MSQEESPSPAEIYQDYLVPGIHARWTPLFLEYAEPEPGHRVLDVACGTGVVARHVAPAVGADGTVVGLDKSPDMLGVARDLGAPDGTTIDWCKGDATVALSEGPFDRVLCQQALQFFEDRAGAVRQINDVLSPDGRAVVSVWKGLSHHPLYEALSKAEAQYLGRPVEALATPFTLGDESELRALFVDAGFNRVEIAEESHPVQFPEPDRFVTLTLLAAASIIPESELDDETRAEMVETIRADIRPTVEKYVEDDTVTFPMHAHIAVAHRS